MDLNPDTQFFTPAALAEFVSFTPPDLEFHEPHHRYSINGRELLGVTAALRAVGLIDPTYYTPEACRRGILVHAAIAAHHRGADLCMFDDRAIDPFLRAYQQFLAEQPLRVDASEERLADPVTGIAGTLDLRGQLLGARDDGPRVDVIDIKTGAVPPSVGYQTAAYVRMLPENVRPRCRRWCLQLTADARYRLIPQLGRNDAAVFLASVTIAKAKQGWR